MTKDLQEKAIDIKGKQYVLVSDRILYFNETYLNGCIKTQMVSEPDADMVVIKAQVTPDSAIPERSFTGYSQATWGEGMVNKTAALENAETSAVGRALAMMGIGVIDSVASVDEMSKAGAVSRPSASKPSQPVSDLTMLCRIHNKPMVERLSSKTGKPYFSHRNDDGTLCFGRPDAKKQELPTIQVDAEAEEVASDVPF